MKHDGRAVRVPMRTGTHGDVLAAVGMAASYGGSIVRLVSDTVRGWDARTVTARLEAAVGRDLQYIRINGTLVGGMVGVVLHVVDSL